MRRVMNNPSVPNGQFGDKLVTNHFYLESNKAIGLFVPTSWEAITMETSVATEAFKSEAFSLLGAGSFVGSFESDELTTVENVDEFLSALSGQKGDQNEMYNDIRLIHNGESFVRAIPRGYKKGETVFGNGVSSGNAIFEVNSVRMRMAESVLLHDAVFSPQSASVMRSGKGFYAPCLLNYGKQENALDGLVAMDPLYEYGSRREIIFSQNAPNIKCIDILAMPICGTGFHNYGHFLFDGLPIAFLLKIILPLTQITLVGPKLSSWQWDILKALGLSDRYMELQEPTMFKRLVVSNLLAQHVSYPVRLIRPLADILRFRVSSPTTKKRRIFVSRKNDINKRILQNRQVTEELLQEFGFEVITPETMSFSEQIKIFSECEIVVGESGAGMANVIFCEPGTKILEIQPENFFEGWIRATSMLMALEWNVYFAKCIENNEGYILFSIDIDLLRSSLLKVLSS